MHVPANGRTNGEPGDQAGEGAYEAEEELVFADEEERLPWLESDDDHEEQGVDTGRIMAFVGVLLLLLILFVGGLWWFTRDRTPGPEVADGSVIAAPEEPYKTRPDDPGGKEVAGTGDASFEVAEGKIVEGRVADTPAPKPVKDTKPGFSESAEPEPEPEQGGVGVQVGAYANREAARRGWDTLYRRYEALDGYKYRTVEAVVDGSTVYRLQAVAASESQARELCQQIKSAGGDCQVKR
ncbi:hypothetical protein FHS61_000201 [Altererythrobacter atlanticus]|uniref:Sporulation related domain protein n=1 Tax=Croceibacterium atlanticum TaxID=1267766 RepID=A0A0F7KTG7_9SPHN|nr:SPOR domain-containing protein [Croceibacterium atlanticum]AKH42431.1 Sporulation related domain protein [Croceibacterium atlanticum]MBB5731208.1 hypothetical protein [Croceibacterium atlanticum]